MRAVQIIAPWLLLGRLQCYMGSLMQLLNPLIVTEETVKLRGKHTMVLQAEVLC